MKKILIGCFIFVVFAALIGCSQSDQKGTLYAKPVDLFAGDAKKFMPFLGSMSGGVQLHYRGSKSSIKAEIEIWEDGKKKGIVASYSQALEQSSDSKDYLFNGEYILSVEIPNNIADEKNATIKVTSSFGSGSYVTEFGATSNLTSTMPIVMNEKGETITDDQTLAIWGMQATDQNGMETVDLTPERLQKVRWAMIVKISLTDEG